MQISLRLQNDPCADGIEQTAVTYPELNSVLVLRGYDVPRSWWEQCDHDRKNPTGATEADWNERRPVAFEVTSIGQSFDSRNHGILLPCFYLTAIPTAVGTAVTE